MTQLSTAKNYSTCRAPNSTTEGTLVLENELHNVRMYITTAIYRELCGNIFAFFKVIYILHNYLHSKVISLAIDNDGWDEYERKTRKKDHNIN